VGLFRGRPLYLNATAFLAAHGEDLPGATDVPKAHPCCAGDGSPERKKGTFLFSLFFPKEM
jgi:hypothetical protein